MSAEKIVRAGSPAIVPLGMVALGFWIVWRLFFRSREDGGSAIDSLSDALRGKSRIEPTVQIEETIDGVRWVVTRTETQYLVSAQAVNDFGALLKGWNIQQDGKSLETGQLSAGRAMEAVAAIPRNEGSRYLLETTNADGSEGYSLVLQWAADGDLF